MHTKETEKGKHLAISLYISIYIPCSLVPASQVFLCKYIQQQLIISLQGYKATGLQVHKLDLTIFVITTSSTQYT